MAGLTGGRFPAPEGSDRRLFEKHLAPWIGRFFADLERAEHAHFYQRVGALGGLFMQVEMEAFALLSEQAE
jgi:TorA maturation chaperone TorD